MFFVCIFSGVSVFNSAIQLSDKAQNQVLVYQDLLFLLELCLGYFRRLNLAVCYLNVVRYYLSLIVYHLGLNFFLMRLNFFLMGLNFFLMGLNFFLMGLNIVLMGLNIVLMGLNIVLIVQLILNAQKPFTVNFLLSPVYGLLHESEQELLFVNFLLILELFLVNFGINLLIRGNEFLRKHTDQFLQHV